MRKIVKLGGLLLLTVATFTACNREKLDDYVVTKDYGTANQMMGDAKDMVDLNFNSTAGGRLAATGCDGVSITFDNSDNFSTPDTMTIDFGTSNTWCRGKMRRGKIIAIRTATYLTEGSVTTISFEDYFVNDHQVEGGKTVTNNGENSDGNLTFSIEANANISLSNGNTVNWTSSRTRTWIAGDETPLERSDDQYEIDGTASGTHSNGGSFGVNITTPIILDLECWINGSCARVSGVSEVTPPNGNIRTIDYGAGTCDCDRTITVNGNTYNVTF